MILKKQSIKAPFSYSWPLPAPICTNSTRRQMSEGKATLDSATLKC